MLLRRWTLTTVGPEFNTDSWSHMSKRFAISSLPVFRGFPPGSPVSSLCKNVKMKKKSSGTPEWLCSNGWSTTANWRSCRVSPATWVWRSVVVYTKSLGLCTTVITTNGAGFSGRTSTATTRLWQSEWVKKIKIKYVRGRPYLSYFFKFRPEDGRGWGVSSLDGLKKIRLCTCGSTYDCDIKF